jgi:hypothetical protein
MKNVKNNNIIVRRFFSNLSIPAKFKNKPVLFFLVFVFLIGLALLPVVVFFLLRDSAFNADAVQINSVIISRTPITDSVSPYKVGDATRFAAIGPPSLFVNNTIGNVYRQIGSNAPQITDTFSTFALRDQGFCNAMTGRCLIRGNWNESQLVCPAGLTGVQKMTEWYVVGGFTSNKVEWYFQCSRTSSVSIGIPPEVLPQGYTAVYKTNSNDIWIASRITSDAIVFMRWGYPLRSTNVVWRSSNKNGKIKNETSSEIFYENAFFYKKGSPADTFGEKDPFGPYKIKLTTTGITIFNSNSIKITDGSRIGYGHFSMYHTLQWCGLNTICNKVLKQDLWDGWPLFVFALQQQNSDQAIAIMFSPFESAIGGVPGTGNGFEITQGNITGDTNNGKFVGHQGGSCLQWTQTLGLCSSNNTIYAPAGDVLIQMKNGFAQWWLDLNNNGIADCSEFGPRGTKYPNQVLPHGIAASTINRNIPTRSKSTWSVSKEGSCAR